MEAGWNLTVPAFEAYLDYFVPRSSFPTITRPPCRSATPLHRSARTLQTPHVPLERRCSLGMPTCFGVSLHPHWRMCARARRLLASRRLLLFACDVFLRVLHCSLSLSPTPDGLAFAHLRLATLLP